MQVGDIGVNERDDDNKKITCTLESVGGKKKNTKKSRLWRINRESGMQNIKKNPPSVPRLSHSINFNACVVYTILMVLVGKKSSVPKRLIKGEMEVTTSVLINNFIVEGPALKMSFNSFF